jgi:hypothetical protein
LAKQYAPNYFIELKAAPAEHKERNMKRACYVILLNLFVFVALPKPI